jgi:hypothetical protein
MASQRQRLCLYQLASGARWRHSSRTELSYGLIVMGLMRGMARMKESQDREQDKDRRDNQTFFKLAYVTIVFGWTVIVQSGQVYSPPCRTGCIFSSTVFGCHLR